MKGTECRWCGGETDAEFVDVGVGWVQVTGSECECGARELGPYMNNGRLTEVEFATAWMGPYEDYPLFSPFNPQSDSEIHGI